MTTKHPLSTTAGLKRALTPGTTVRIVNHLHPHLNRLSTVLPKTNGRAICWTADTAPKGAWLDWPKAVDLVPDENDPRRVRVEFTDHKGERRPFLDLTVLESEHLDHLEAAR